MNRYLAGAVGGLLATLPMTLLMEAGWRRLPVRQRYPLPPREITQLVLAKTSVRTPQADRDLLVMSLAAHFAYGALTGAVYGCALRRVQRPAATGAGFGVSIWAASYLGWIPAAHILRPASQHPGRRNLLMLAAHLLWGSMTATLAHALAAPDTGKRDSRYSKWRHMS